MNDSFTPVIFSLDRQTLLVQTSAGHVVGELEPRYSKILQVLQEDRDIELQAYVVPSLYQKPPRDQAKGSPKDLAPSHIRSVSLSVVLYGTMEIFEDIGKFFKQCSEYLQSPLRCDRNVPYRNPQSLSGKDPSAPMTLHLEAELSHSQIETMVQGADPSAALETEDTLRETQAPPPIKACLYK